MEVRVLSAALKLGNDVATGRGAAMGRLRRDGRRECGEDALTLAGAMGWFCLRFAVVWSSGKLKWRWPHLRLRVALAEPSEELRLPRMRFSWCRSALWRRTLPSSMTLLCGWQSVVSCST